MQAKSLENPEMRNLYRQILRKGNWDLYRQIPEKKYSAMKIPHDDFHKFNSLASFFPATSSTPSTDPHPRTYSY